VGIDPDNSHLFVPEMTVETIAARISRAAANKEHKINCSPEESHDFDSSKIRTSISEATIRSQVGVRVTPMTLVPAPLRGLARLVGKIVIRLASFITVEQRDFNMHVTNGLALLTDGVEHAINQSKALDQNMNASRRAVADWNEAQQESIADLKSRHKKIRDDLAYLKTSMVLMERRIAMLIEETRNRLPEPFDQEQLRKIGAEARSGLDAFYAAFEERFRGTEEEITERLQVYLPYVRKARERTTGAIVLDLGCGRGEWLELLYREGIPARGIDTNRLMIARCRERCLEVVHEDVFAYLRSRANEEIGAITGFHIVEHFPFELLVGFIDEALRVLKPGGMIILETPNSQNVLVGSCDFYRDPTHQRPYPSETMKLLMESRGFADVEILELHPSTATVIAEETDVAGRFNQFFYGPMDYAVIGKRG
jgi:SAM-dependent methyltransferase